MLPQYLRTLPQYPRTLLRFQPIERVDPALPQALPHRALGAHAGRLVVVLHPPDRAVGGNIRPRSSLFPLAGPLAFQYQELQVTVPHQDRPRDHPPGAVEPEDFAAEVQAPVIPPIPATILGKVVGEVITDIVLLCLRHPALKSSMIIAEEF